MVAVAVQKKAVFMAGKVTNNKKRHPRKDVSAQAHHNKAHQRRVIRVSETFEESRSSGDARPKRSEVVGIPLKGDVTK